jgi:hypothetical protein
MALHLHAEILGEHAGCEHGVKVEPGKALRVHNAYASEATADDPNRVVHRLYRRLQEPVLRSIRSRS